MAVMDFEPETKLMRVISINPGYTFDEIQDNCEFELLKAPRIFTTKPPTATELRILRDQIDPSRHIIGR
jgi:acyl CoA:acetate/3-ketoacid CoA transferase beta subunit